MSKKYLLLKVVLLGIVVFVAGCGGGRDMSKPSTRLVGHWRHFYEGVDSVSIATYFGALKEDGEGSFVFEGLVGETYYAQYRVLSDSGDTVTISVFAGSETATGTMSYDYRMFYDLITETMSYNVAQDGQTMYRLENSDFVYQYVDSKSEP
jgi:hypothetical protein